MAKRPIPGNKVDLHEECAAHGEDLPEAAVGMRPSRPPTERISRPAPKPVAASEPETGFTGKALENAVERALAAPPQTSHAGGGF